MHGIESVIWDWNGTLLDDVDVCIDSINELLSERGHRLLTRSLYRDIFTFPVKEYYKLAGFDFREEPFDTVAIEFIDRYKEKVRQCGMYPDARPALEWFRGNGYSQYLISAMEHQFLMDSLENSGIDYFFDDFSGINDHYADGKASMARDFIERKGIDPSSTLFIGDTLHDFEVARSMGMPCMLVADGHQSEVRLMSSGCDVVRSLSEVVGRFDMNPPGLPGLNNKG